VTTLRLNVRGVIVRDGLLVVSSEERHGVNRPFLPGASVRDRESVVGALIRGVREDVGIEVIPRRLLYVAEVVGVYGVHDLNLVWLADPLDPDAPLDGLATVALNSDRGYAILPPLIEEIVADAADEFDNAPRWLGNVGRSYLSLEEKSDSD
jgi:ADP-ribose pyrophosphatase YjhB (NUDIX family)